MIYFKNDILLYQKDLKVMEGIKNGVKPANLCYYFGWIKEMIEDEIKQHGKIEALDDIQKKMKDTGCSCEIKNLSESCCLGDVKKAINEMKEKF